jgi:hypothetical protein
MNTSNTKHYYRIKQNPTYITWKIKQQGLMILAALKFTASVQPPTFLSYIEKINVLSF